MPSLSVWKIVAQPDQVRVEKVILLEEIHTLDGASLCLPGGAYTTLRTYHGDKVLHFSNHIHRLEETAGLAGRPIHLDEHIPRAALRNLREEFSTKIPSVGDVRIRLTLDLECILGDLYISMEPLVSLPRQAYETGVRVITCDIQRQLPKAKLTRFIDRSSPLRDSLPPDVNEAVMLDGQDRFLEGLSSNFFAVLDGDLWTAEQGVLSGFTRALVIQCARQLGLPLRLEPPRRAEISSFDEVFLSSSSRGVLPVRQVDEHGIGKTCPGPITQQLMKSYNAALEDQLEPI